MRKTLALVLSLLMAASSCLSAGALTLTNVETAAEPAVAETPVNGGETVLAAVSNKPGLNVFTGTTEPETFDSDKWANEKWTQYFDGNDTVELSNQYWTGWHLTTETPEGFSGKALKLWLKYPGEHYPQFSFKIPLQQGKKYSYSFRFGDNGNSDRCLWHMQYPKSGSAVYALAYKDTVKDNSSAVFENRELLRSLPDSAAMCFQTKKHADDEGVYWYLDDISVIPYYQITYLNDDNSVITVDQVLYDAEGNFLTAYAPKSDVSATPSGFIGELIGWSTEKGATEPMTEVALANEDVALYPVWHKAEGYELSTGGRNINDGGSAIAVTASQKPVEWRVDLGTTKARYDIIDNGMTCRVGGTGYAGKFSVTAVFEGGIEVTKNLQFTDGTKWQPGLGILSGTTEGVDVDFMNEGETFGNTFYNAGNCWSRVANPDKTGNLSDTVLSVNGSWQYIRPAVSWNPVIEIERPVSVVYDLYSKGNERVAVLVNTSGAPGLVIDGHTHTTPGAWQHVEETFITAKRQSAADTCAAAGGISYINIGVRGDALTASPAYFDNLDFIPYYKITYKNDNDEVIASEYVLYDSNKKVLTSYTPNKAIIPNAAAVKAISTEKGGANVDSVPLNHEDITLYVSYHDRAPKNTDEYSIRLGAIRGMRMTSFVSALQRGLADEYGFLVAADNFGGDYSAFVFADDMKGSTSLAEGETGKGTLANGAKFVYATSYDKATGVDIHKVGSFGDEDGFLINAVLVNIPVEQYATKFAVRPYVRVGDSYFYGEVMVKSIKDVAEVLSLDDAYMDSLSDEDFEYIDAILGA